jgi:acetolactate synthase-1/2/3 large subunit
MNGGELIAEVLERQGVRFLFTLCGGHISPILVASQKLGIRVVDMRDEANAVFAADAVARMTGVPGVAAVTAGPGVTNAITAVQNARLAQSPLILLGGATATALKGRGALQDIDQIALIEPIVKAAIRVKRVKDLVPAVEEAFALAQAGVPGPVFVECAVDLLYDESLVREWYADMTGGGKAKGLPAKALKAYATAHLFRIFQGAGSARPGRMITPVTPAPEAAEVERAAALLEAAERPVLVMGSQSVVDARSAPAIADAVDRLGIPTFLGGMSRGLLGHESPIQLRHKRGVALARCDLLLVAGFPFDFRMGYGFGVNARAKIVSINRSREELTKNRRPTLGIHADAGRFLYELANRARPNRERWAAWLSDLEARDAERDAEIAVQASAPTEYVNPLYLCQEIEKVVADDSVLVVDGGDFVATASYIVRPRGPLSWLDPGVFGTLGVGGGFAVGAALARPTSEVWLFYGDGSSAYSLAEIDTFVRHGLKVIAVVGTDGSWAQIARDQSTILGDAVGTVLRRSAYHEVAQGYGGVGLLLERPEDVPATLAKAKAIAAEGRPVVINAMIGATDFRKGSLSI